MADRQHVIIIARIIAPLILWFSKIFACSADLVVRVRLLLYRRLIQAAG